MDLFRTGKTVYGNGSYAPNRGTNNPAGYIKREVNKTGPLGGVSNFGSTGRSETRSGLARKALERQGLKEAKPAQPANGFIKQKPVSDPVKKLGTQAARKQRRKMIVTKFGALKLGSN